MSLTSLLLLPLVLLVACAFEPASKWDASRGRFISTDQLEQERRDAERARLRELRELEDRVKRLEERR